MKQVNLEGKNHILILFDGENMVADVNVDIRQIVIAVTEIAEKLSTDQLFLLQDLMNKKWRASLGEGAVISIRP